MLGREGLRSGGSTGRGGCKVILVIGDAECIGSEDTEGNVGLLGSAGVCGVMGVMIVRLPHLLHRCG